MVRRRWPNAEIIPKEQMQPKEHLQNHKNPTNIQENIKTSEKKAIWS